MTDQKMHTYNQKIQVEFYNRNGTKITDVLGFEELARDYALRLKEAGYNDISILNLHTGQPIEL